MKLLINDSIFISVVTEPDNVSNTVFKSVLKNFHIDLITSCPWLSCDYAIEILKTRFPEGEHIISTNKHASFAYLEKYPCVSICEQAISKSLSFSMMYAKWVLRGRFVLGEPVIAKNAFYSYQYAKDILNERFPLGESVILESHYKDNYISLFRLFPES